MPQYDSTVRRVDGEAQGSELIAPMEPQQEAHLKRIKDSFQTLVDVKYRKGQKEHGGDLHQKGTLSLIEFAIDEAIDQLVYLLTIKEQLTR